MSNSDKKYLSEKRIRIAVVVFVILFITVGAVDVVTGEPTVSDINASNSTTLDDEGRLHLGSVDVNNPSPLPKPFNDKPQYHACAPSANSIEHPNREIMFVQIDSNFDDNIWFSEQKDLYINSYVGPDTDTLEGYEVNVSDNCPTSSNETDNTIFLFDGVR